MSNFSLLGATYCSFDNVSVSGGLNSRGLASHMAAFLEKNIQSFEPCVSPSKPIPHLLVSTSVSSEFNSNEHVWPDAVAAFSECMDHPPSMFINAYECASWGYALRCANQFFSDGECILISIVDLNLNNLSFWNYSNEWGSSGFGVCTLLIKLGSTSTLKVAQSVSSNPMADFCLNIKRQASRHNADIVSMPFFPKKTRELNDRMLKKLNRMTDLHEQYGHCFGSDPWISLIKGGEAIKGKTVLSCSLAYSGYWSVMAIDVAETAVFKYYQSDFLVSAVDVPQGERHDSDKQFEHYKFKLTGSPFHTECMPSHQLSMPLSSDDDFKMLSDPKDHVPCYVTPFTKYKNIESIYLSKKELLDFAVIRIPAPSMTPLPNSMLADNVICCIDSEYFLSGFLSSGQLNSRRLLSISDRSYLPYIDSDGDNTLAMMVPKGKSLAIELSFAHSVYKELRA